MARKLYSDKWFLLLLQQLELPIAEGVDVVSAIRNARVSDARYRVDSRDLAA